ncbi:hypothetical protein [Tabrizicola sp. BL-A-41-H6]|uniref:hypothetical protein n=1 Tax=Tabrizicola sp. BL-A-41-H6 TaxID=3421107 RepID=UPI003D67EEBD
MTARRPGRDAEHLDGAFAEFSLLRGRFNQFAARTAHRLFGGGALSFEILLSGLLWLILAALVILEGHHRKFFSLDAAAIHARMLVAVPLFLWCSALLDRAARDACASLVKVGIVAGAAKDVLDRQATRLARLFNSALLQVVLVVGVVAIGLLTPRDYLPGVSSFAGNMTDDVAGSLAGRWYVWVCLPVFRFVLLRLCVMFLLWTYLIWKLSRQRLHLVASHPDRAGGLGLLEVAQTQLLIFVLAIAVIDAAAFAEMSRLSELIEQDVYVHSFLIALVGLAVICGPLLFLSAPLFQCRRLGNIEFGALAHEYSTLFRKRWIETGSAEHDNLLGASDIQSLADLDGSYQNVRTMRVLPVTGTLVVVILGCAAVPHLPLLLLKYPMTDLISDLVQTMIGVEGRQ